MSPFYKNLKHKFVIPSFILEKKADKSNRQIQKISTALLLTVLATGVLYLGQINAIATKGYAIKGLEKQIRGIQAENEKLEYQIAQESSLDVLKGRIESLHLVRSDSIEYIKPDHPVAVAQ